MAERCLLMAQYASAIGAALFAGIFFAFSNFVMRGLGRLPPSRGIAAMQHINVAVINPGFMLPFVGTALLCVVVAAHSVCAWHAAGSRWLLVGAVLYVAGCFAVTLVGNVPLNDALARATPDSAAGASLWQRYLSRWMVWNHVRTAAALGAFVALLVGLREAG